MLPLTAWGGSYIGLPPASPTSATVRNPDNPDKWGPPWVPELDENWELTGELVQNDFEACIRKQRSDAGEVVEPRLLPDGKMM